MHGSLPLPEPPSPERQPQKAPPPLSDLLDWRVPYVDVLAMISVSRVYACDSLLDGLRAPPLTGLPSPAAMANGAMQTASSSELAMIQTRRDMCGDLPRSVTCLPPCNRSPRRGSRSRPAYVSTATTRQSSRRAIASARLVTSGNSRCRPVISKVRPMLGSVLTTTSWPLRLRTRLCASTSAVRPEESM